MNDAWRQRLREAVNRSGRKQSAIAADAEVTEVTLSRILNAANVRPAFQTVVRITRAAGENVGWLLDEEGFRLSTEQRVKLRGAATIILNVTRDEPLTPQ